MIEFIRFGLSDIVIIYLLGYMLNMGVFYSYNDRKIAEHHFTTALISWLSIFVVFRILFRNRNKKSDETTKS